jgi:hypothetical protein
MAGRARTLTLKTKVDVTGADKLDGLASKLTSTGKTLTAGLTLPIVGLGAAVFAAAEEADRAERKLTNTFRSMGAAVWTTTDALKAQASALQDVTTFGDEEILELQAVMLTFGNVTGESFDRATKAALDMSSLLGQDLQTSAIQLGKALNDPIKGVAALRRVGVSFTESQLEQIKVMQQSGDLMGAQTLILNELERQFGGTAEEMAKTAGGQFKQAMNQLGEAAEEFGAVLVPVIKDIATGIKDFAKWLQTLNPETKEWVVRIAALLAALGPLLIILGTLTRAFLALRLAGLAFVAVAPRIGAAAHTMLGPLGLVTAAISVLIAVSAEFTRSTEYMGDALKGLAERAGISGGEVNRQIQQLADDLNITFEQAQRSVLDYTDNLGLGVDQAIDAIRAMPPEFERVFNGVSEELLQSGSDWENYQNQILGIVEQGTTDMVDEIGAVPGEMADAMIANQFELTGPGGAIEQLVNAMATALTPAQEVANAIGFLTSDEYKQGIESGKPAAVAKAEELANAAVEVLNVNGFNGGASTVETWLNGMVWAFQYRRRFTIDAIAAQAGNVFGRSLPTEGPLKGGVFAGGRSVVQSWVEGILSGQRAVASAFSTIVGAGMPSLASVPAGAGAGGVQYHTHINLTVEGSLQATDEGSLRRTLQRMGEQWG